MIVRRDDDLAAAWRAKGAEVVMADLGKTGDVTRALRGVSGAYLMNPPAYFAPDLFEQARTVHASLVAGANAAQVPCVVALSSVGAQHAGGTGNILTTHDFEQQLKAYEGTATILRAANFIENWAWSMRPVLDHGVLPSMFTPLDKALPMVSALDIGRTAATLLTQRPTTSRVVELHGPESYSPADAAQAFSAALGRRIEAVEDSATQFASVMADKGFPATTVKGLIDMFEGFNSGLIAFEGVHETHRGEVSLQDAVLAMLRPGTPA